LGLFSLRMRRNANLKASGQKSDLAVRFGDPVSCNCGGLAPHYILCVYINSISISLDNIRFIRRYVNSSFSIIAEFLQFISLPRLASTDIVDNIHLEVAALLLACV